MDDPAHSQVDSEAMLAGEGHALRALARSLLGCSDADDVVQQGYAAAIEAPLAARRLGPWLAGTVRHLAKMLRRSETRRRRREQFAAREVIDAGSELRLGSPGIACLTDAGGRVLLKQRVPGAHTVSDDTGKLFKQTVTILPGLNPEVVVLLPAAAR